MIWKFALVMFFGKIISYAYNVYASRSLYKRNTPENTFEKRNICKKTAKALLWESLAYLFLVVIGLIFKI